MRIKFIFKSVLKKKNKQKLKIGLRIILILLILTFSGVWQIKKDKPKVLIANTNISQLKTNRKDFYLIIPKIKIESPIIPDVKGGDKDVYFKALETGVAQLKGSSKPGEGSNIVVFGHSSFYKDQPGEFKEIFKNIDQLSQNDEIIIWYKNKEYKYLIRETMIVDPQDVWVTKPTEKEQVTISTCYPPGTTQQRFIVMAELIRG